jgi:hypothetical protein
MKSCAFAEAAERSFEVILRGGFVAYWRRDDLMTIAELKWR